MDTAMTTFARGVPAPKRAVAAFTSFEHAAMNRKAIVAARRDDVRSAITASEAERQAIQRDQAWIDRAAFAGLRMIPRG
jgi:hypothetical protein